MVQLPADVGDAPKPPACKIYADDRGQKNIPEFRVSITTVSDGEIRDCSCFFVPGKLMAALAYRDAKILARNLLLRPFFCLSAPGDRQEVGGESPPR
jgi:hypothetical protein